MPIADDPRPNPSDEPGRDPFDDLVLDERFVRAATVKEPTARTRMLTARWRHQPPVDPGGRRWSPAAGDVLTADNHLPTDLAPTRPQSARPV
ncbi:hypothetical protein ACFP3U_12850 [Kitasatospora misakiensis]|uniref:Uncharacterized protein n=1 Tax=Kitasatospora misakiensis TaxID=67330 RepID=A0ABW0X3Z5_9ACTN